MNHPMQIFASYLFCFAYFSHIKHLVDMESSDKNTDMEKKMGLSSV